MKSMVFAAALVALADALPDNPLSFRHWKRNNIVNRYVKGKEQPIEPPTLGAPTVQGCFKSAGNMTMVDTPEFNSIDKCGKDICASKGYTAAGSSGGNQCWCGYVYPPKSDLVDDDNCDVGCTGFGQHACGGIDYWTIYNTGVNLAVKYMEDQKSSTSSSSTATPTHTSEPEKTLIVTASPTSSSDADEDKGGGTNVAGVAAGVVVGVVVVAALIGGGFVYMRRKRNKEIEEEHRRNAAVNAFIGKTPRSSGGTSMSDSRLDPILAARRMSDGSIADNQDYSRRILRVTNA
ncbi:hypothetical protein MYCTH_2315848 [Thermothelomyces thermophilus ATCC 42464]|uniref:WSC domain-containing protein n=1 Tax=Thermothelomyces thermophilus (strain ATCC 42464 / BCRC 31852 / DSM 1799) TaxID=573729 RepID=G2QJI7_THET4|nr:uncharacterized protein MYCTH_2315848 [Thermothelomyces thermophilus ATCC 42464]AEO59744.1 hypothetical protein MYCTH_2315848 [Thermothelomyces thermophilus ATCC 42464]